MSRWTNPDNLTFAGAQFRLLLPAANQRAPRPRPASTAAWVHIPYGGNKHETDNSLLHTVWTPQGGILIVDEAAYATFEAFYQRFASLMTPWGTLSAKLAQLEVARFDDGSYRGPVSFEWA